MSPTRFYVQEKAYDKFVAKFIEATRAITVGHGLEPATKMGPLAHERRVPAMESFVEDARAVGANVQIGGGRMSGAGNFFAPTVVTEVPDHARLMTLEPFGPIAPITRFSTFDEVVARANSLPYGLASFAFTTSAKTSQAIGMALEAGMVSINHWGLALPELPFGGIKDSGIGSEGGTETFDGYLNTKLISEMH